jgi:nicotinate-nucleotide adenylyltransferase
MKIGILGGTFNPIHLAHLRIAAEVRDRLSLDQIIFIPAATPPHKELDGDIDYADRRAMVTLAIAGEPAYAVSDIEERRGGRSYSVLTLAELQTLHPADELFFIIGSDSFLEIATWYRATELFTLSNIVVVERPRAKLIDLLAALPVAMRSDFCYDSVAMCLTHRSGFSVYYLPGTPLAISSSEIRRLVRTGQSIRHLVPDAVARYISDKRIYLNDC